MVMRTTHRFSVEDYYRMAETGVIPPGARVELIGGEIIDMSPIGPLHGGMVNQLLELFTSLAQRRWMVAVQNPLRLGPDSEPEPDLLLLKRRANFYRRHHPTPEDVFLLVEVADNTVDYDRSVKIPLYGRCGVPEVWLVNLPEGIIEVYRSPHFTGYAEKLILSAGQRAQVAAFPDVSLDVSELFARD
jgi:Uma2 family endonuclease